VFSFETSVTLSEVEVLFENDACFANVGFDFAQPDNLKTEY
jgi:hypothetical protein